MKKILFLMLIGLSVFGRNLNLGIPLELRPDSGCIILTNRIHNDSTLDTIAYIDTNGIWHKYGNFSDSLWSKIIRGEYGVLDSALIDTIKGYLIGKADSAGYADSSSWTDLLDGYNENYFLDTLLSYWNFSDSLKTPKVIADSIELEDSLKIYRKADTIKFVGSSTCNWDLSNFDILFKTGIHTIDNIVPYTQDSSSSKLGSVNNPFGEHYNAFMYSFLSRMDTTEIRIDLGGYAEIYIDTVGTDSIIVEIGATRKGVAIE